MKADAHDDRPQSLGALVSSLRPGEPCPWCGGILQVARTARCVDASRPDEGVDGLEGPVLECAECGSEVHLCGVGAHRGTRSRLGAAA